MAYKFDIFTRLTSRYADGWSNLEEKEFAGTVKVLAPTCVIETGGYDYGVVTRFRVVAPPALKSTDLSRPIKQTMSGSGCRHDYDCCGCASHYASVRRVSPREYSVQVRTSYNY